MSRCVLPSSTWTKRNLRRAKLFELQRMAWKIFFLQRREMTDSVKRRVIEYCELMHSLKDVPVHLLDKELARPDAGVSNLGPKANQTEAAFSGRERTMSKILHSKLLTTRMRTLLSHRHDNCEPHYTRDRTTAGHLQPVQSKPCEDSQSVSCSSLAATSSFTLCSSSAPTSSFVSCSYSAPTSSFASSPYTTPTSSFASSSYTTPTSSFASSPYTTPTSSSVSSANILNPRRRVGHSMSTQPHTRNTRPLPHKDPSLSSEEILEDKSFRKPSSLDSVFFRSLSSQSTSRQRSKSALPKPQMMKNRPGQRKRRLQAEKLYGSGAKHMKKELARKPVGHPRNTTTRGNTQAKAVKGHRGSKLPSKPSQRPTSAPLTPKPRVSSERAEELHPSWLASKRRKENLKQTMTSAPQGQRTVFKDSDED